MARLLVEIPSLLELDDESAAKARQIAHRKGLLDVEARLLQREALQEVSRDRGEAAERLVAESVEVLDRAGLEVQALSYSSSRDASWSDSWGT